MDTAQRRPWGWGSGVATAATVLLLAGCAGAPPTDSASSQASPSPSAASAPATRASHGPSLSPGDQRACAGAESLVGHLAAVTARWSPQRRPFDPHVRRDITSFAGNLAAQRRFADTPPVRAAISANASSFTGMAAAMTERNHRHVTRAIADVRVHYKMLKSVCALTN